MNFIEFVRHTISLFNIKQGSLWNLIGTNRSGEYIANALVDLWIVSVQAANPSGPSWDELDEKLEEELKEYDFPSDTKVSQLSTEEFILYQAVRAIKAKVSLAVMLTK